MTAFPGGLVWYKLSRKDAEDLVSTFINPDEVQTGQVFPAIVVRMHCKRDGGNSLLSRTFESADISVMLPGGVFWYIPGVTSQMSNVEVDGLTEPQPDPGHLMFSCPLSLQVLI